MGKAKKPAPEPDKIIRVVGKNLSISVTEDEKKYRNRNGPDDVSEISKEKLKCTVCSKSVQDIVKKAAYPFIHTVLGVLMCKECASFYGDGYFSNDEDGDDKYCRWCGQGGTLYLCSACTCAFCKKCLKQNLDKKDIKDIESDDWKCLICHPKPLFDRRTVCWALQENAKKNSKEEEEAVRPSRSSKTAKSEIQSKKRKAIEIEVDSEPDINSRTSKKKKNEESTNTQSIRNSDKGYGKKNETKKRTNRSLSPKTASTPAKKFSRHSLRDTKPSKMTEVVTLSDSEEEDYSPEHITKPAKKDNSTSRNKKAKGDSKESPKVTADTARPKRVTALKKFETNPNINSNKTPKKSSTPKTSPKKKATSLSKKATSKKKKPSRKAKKEESEEEEESEVEEEEDKPRFLSLSDEDSTNELEIKKPSSKKDAKKSKTKLTISRSADSDVIPAVKYLDSAMKDVSELTILMSNRCEKLCNKPVKTREDVIYVFNKLTQLMTAVHTNLNFIEQGVSGKITVWNSDKSSEKVDIESQSSAGNLQTKEDCSSNEVNQKKDEEASEQTKENNDELVQSKEESMEVGESKAKEEIMEVDSENIASSQNEEIKKNELSNCEAQDVDSPTEIQIEQEEQTGSLKFNEQVTEEEMDSIENKEDTSVHEDVESNDEKQVEEIKSDQNEAIEKSGNEILSEKMNHEENPQNEREDDNIEEKSSESVKDHDDPSAIDNVEESKSDEENENKNDAETESNQVDQEGNVNEATYDIVQEKDEDELEDTKKSENERVLEENNEKTKYFDSDNSAEGTNENSTPADEANGEVSSTEDTLDPFTSSEKQEGNFEKADEESTYMFKPEESDSRVTNGSDDFDQTQSVHSTKNTAEETKNKSEESNSTDDDMSRLTRTETEENSCLPETPRTVFDDFKNCSNIGGNSFDITKEENKPEENESKPIEPERPKEDTPKPLLIPTISDERRPHQGYGSHSSSASPYHHSSDRDNKGHYTHSGTDTTRDRHRDDRDRNRDSRDWNRGRPGWNQGYQGGYQQRGRYHGNSNWRGYY